VEELKLRLPSEERDDLNSVMEDIQEKHGAHFETLETPSVGVQLFLEQARSPGSRRKWSPQLIRFCLRVWSRSKVAYAAMKRDLCSRVVGR
jgi:hypothetical protein